MSKLLIAVFAMLGLSVAWAASIVPTRGWMLWIVSACCFTIAFGEYRMRPRN